MKEKDLRKLGRTELLEMLIAQSKEVMRLQAELDEANHKLDEARKKLEDRNIVISNAGSIAEAALQINGVFDTAQQAAQQYLDNLNGIQAKCDEMEARSQQMLADTQARCDELVQKAREDSQAWWDRTAKRLEAFYAEHPGLREQLIAQYSSNIQERK